MTLEDLKRSTAAHRQDSVHARDARISLSIALAHTSDPELAIMQARTMLAGCKLPLEHIAEIETRARAGEPGLTARENGASEAARARSLVRRH